MEMNLKRKMFLVGDIFMRKYYTIFINFENFTDTRQSRYKRVVNDSNASPSFDDIWTHTEGFTFNGGIKFKL